MTSEKWRTRGSCHWNGFWWSCNLWGSILRWNTARWRQAQLSWGPRSITFLVVWRQGTSYVGSFGYGALHGKGVFSYPDGASIRGEWDRGELRKGRIIASTFPKLFQETLKKRENEILYFDQSTRERLSRQPLRQDAYEFCYSYVQPSSIPGAGEGLFAKVDLPAGFVCAFYNGIRVPLKITNKRTWRENANNISLNNGMCIDVPADLSDLNVYCATTGHKCNHHPTLQNAAYDTFYSHPVFGKIKCIRTTRAVSQDEEIFVGYGYKPGQGPLWYRQLEKETKKK